MHPICTLLRRRVNLHFQFSITASHTQKAPLSRCFQLVEKVRFLFCASCDSTHKIEFAQQIHKNRGRVPRFLYKGRKNVSGGRGFSSAFDRKRGFDREAARKTIVFRQPQAHRKVCLSPWRPKMCCHFSQFIMSSFRYSYKFPSRY